MKTTYYFGKQNAVGNKVKLIKSRSAGFTAYRAAERGTGSRNGGRVVLTTVVRCMLVLQLTEQPNEVLGLEMKLKWSPEKRMAMGVERELNRGIVDIRERTKI